MRFYRNLIQASIEALEKILVQHALADRVVQATLRSNKKWGAKDRRFIAATIYDVVRWYRWYYEILGKKPKQKTDWWQLLGIHWILQGIELPDWTEFSMLDPTAIQEKAATLAQKRAVRQSIPDWLDAVGEEELGTTWAACLKALNEPAPLIIRANTLKSSPQQVAQQLAKQNIPTEALTGFPAALLIPKRAKVTALEAYKKGLFEVQDAASQLVAPFLQVAEDMQVVDACAGAGGKSLHLAALMQQKGKITALDIYAKKLTELEKRARRANAHQLRTQLIKNNTSIKNLYQTADRLLLDVPCSGLGTLRRSPHLKWRLTADFLQEIRATQQQILQEYSPICKVGGLLVYATCSILPSENQVQIATFLNSEAGQYFEQQEERIILPVEGFDGFYMVRLKRKK